MRNVWNELEKVITEQSGWWYATGYMQALSEVRNSNKMTEEDFDNLIEDLYEDNKQEE